MWSSLIFIVVLILSVGFAYWTDSLFYVIHPEPFISDINGDSILKFIAIIIFLFMAFTALSWISAYIINSLTREKSQDKLRIGIETNVELSWAWGFLVAGCVMVFFTAFVIFYYGVAASGFWESLLAFSPHLLIFIILLALSLVKSSQTS